MGRPIATAPGESTRMKVIVDFEVCQSHGLCMQAAPEVFELRDDGFLYILAETPPENLRKKVETAVRECPTGAIKLEG
jgi:ferredoxin